MPKNLGRRMQEPKRKIRIKWVGKDKLEAAFGHGIEFWYSRGDILNSETDILVAIVEGFNWFHNPLQKSVIVKILPEDSSFFKRSKTPADEIINAIRFGAKKFFETSPWKNKATQEIRVTKETKITEDVKVSLNG